MHANRIAKHRPSRKQNGRDSAMVTTFSQKGKCRVWNKTGHWAKDCDHRKSSMKDTRTNTTSKKLCCLHKTHLPDNSEECRSQQQQLNGINGNNRNGHRKGQYHAITTTPAHANTAMNFGSTTVVENCNDATASVHATTTVTSTTSTETPCTTLLASPQGFG